MAEGGASNGSFLRKAGPLVLARMFAAGVTACIPLVLARAMELDEYGTYKQLFLIAQTLYYILPFGVAQSLYFFVPRTDAPRPWIAQTLAFLAAVGIAGGCATIALAPQGASWFENPELAQYALPLALYVVGLVGSMPLEITLTSQGRTKAAAAVYLVCDGARAAAMVVPVLLGFGLTGAMNAMAAFSLLRLVATWVLLLRGTKGPLLARGALGRQLAYAVPFGASLLLLVFNSNAHQYAVGAHVPPELFAIYAVGCFQLPFVDLLYTPTSDVLMVRVGELEREGRVRESIHAFREAAAKLSYAFLPMSAFLFVAAPEFIAALFGARYLDAVPIFRVSVLGIALAILPMDGILRARNETRYLFVSYLVKSLVTVPLLYFGVRHLGLMGGIGAWAVAEFVGKATLLARVPKALGYEEGSLLVRVARVLPWKDFGKAAAAAVGAGFAVVVARSATPEMFASLPQGEVWRTIPLAAIGVMFVFGYFALLRVAGVRPFSAMAALRRSS